MVIDSKYMPSLGRLFTPIVMESLEQKGYSHYLSEVCVNSGLLKKLDSTITLGEFFDLVYSILLKNYRNEYIYKNVITSKILLGRHSLNTSQMLTEFRVGTNIADLVLLNGSSTVYEIKSEYDSFTRLQKQVETYLEIFDYVNVITSHTQAMRLNNILPGKVGILVLTERNSISTIRKAISNKESTNPEILFDSLRKAEYTSIIKNYFGSIPDVPNTQIYNVCKKLFCEIPPVMVHDLTIKILKERINSIRLTEYIEKVPSSVSAYALSVCNKGKKMEKLLSLFHNKCKSLII